jgi:hypothetical protein
LLQRFDAMKQIPALRERVRSSSSQFAVINVTVVPSFGSIRPRYCGSTW